MSAASLLTAIASAPFGLTANRSMRERIYARWKLRHHADLDTDLVPEPREGSPVRVTGVVQSLDDLLIAPLSGKPCVAYRSRVWAALRHAASAETMQLRPFVLDCGNADSVIVDGDHAVFSLPYVALVDADRDREHSFLARHGLQRQRARFSEVALEIGMTVTIAGTLVLSPVDEPPVDELGFRDLPPPMLQLGGSRERPLVIIAP
ncbi:MAG: hypothetical protein WKG01_35470 [Kofleriaceae bacterium]